MNQSGSASADAPGVAGHAISEAMKAEGGNPDRGWITIVLNGFNLTILGSRAAQLQSKVTKERNAETGKSVLTALLP